MTTQTYDKNFGLKDTPALPENWANLLAVWEERGKEVITAAKGNRSGRYEVVWSGYDIANAAHSLLKKAIGLAVQADLYPETKGALPWLVEAARLAVEMERCAATGIAVVRGGEQTGTLPLRPTTTAPEGVSAEKQIRLGAEPEAQTEEHRYTLVPMHDREADTPTVTGCPGSGQMVEVQYGLARVDSAPSDEEAKGIQAASETEQPTPEEPDAKSESNDVERPIGVTCPVCTAEFEGVIANVVPFHRHGGRDCEGSGAEVPTWVVEKS